MLPSAFALLLTQYIFENIYEDKCNKNQSMEYCCTEVLDPVSFMVF